MFDAWLRDPHITVGRDVYYLTGTSRPEGHEPRGGNNTSDGLRIWRSEDLREYIPMGLVWKLDDGPEWMRDYHVLGLDGKDTTTPNEFACAIVPEGHVVRRALWAPKIHFSPSRDNHYVVAGLNFNRGVPLAQWIRGQFGGTFLLESTTREAVGPYRVPTQLPMSHSIDLILFEDDDGSLYLA